MGTGRPGRWAVLAAAMALLACTGCGGVNRRFVITSNVPNAQVYVNNRPVGAAPAYAAFEYYGDYNIELVHPDFERQTRRVHVRAPWFAYPPLDFFSEVFWPFHIDDARYYYFQLEPRVRTDTAELTQKAEELRQRGYELPLPEHPAPRKLPKPPPPPEVVPPVSPEGGPGTVPSVTPPGVIEPGG